MVFEKRMPSGTSMAVLVLAVACASAEEPEPEGVPAPRGATLEPAAEAALRDMSNRLAAADAFTVDATRHIDATLITVRDAAEDARIQVMVKRPDKLRAVSRSNLGVRHFYFDGQTITVFDETRNMYAAAPVRGTIDDMVRVLDERYGFVPPLAEFIVNDPWAKIRNQVRAGRVVGTETIDGEACRKLQLTGELAVAELWVATDDDLPCRLVATFVEIEGDPQVRADFANWRRAPDLTDAMFTFTPPPGARQIPMVPVSELEDGR